MTGPVHTPIGEIPKKWAIGLGVAVVIGVAVYYRHYQSKQAAAAVASAGANTGIDPATGYAYGSAEDAAALAAQGSYITPVVGTGGGGGSGTVAGVPTDGSLPVAFGSNPEWVQYVVGYVRDKQQVTDNGSAMQAALSVYVTGGIPTPDQTSLINQAIAIAGYPPVAGPNGYPPHINTSNANGGNPTGHTFRFKLAEDAGTPNAPAVYIGIPGSGYYWAPSITALQSYLAVAQPIDLGTLAKTDAETRFGSLKPWSALP